MQAGTRLGAYEILSVLGQGGMGEVYRARDTRLNREVALKVLPDAVAQDPDRLARFEREAQALAALNHPHIAQIYGIEESTSVRALVMECVDGPTLEELIRNGGALPLDDALSVARQVAEALEAAHERGIVHRDLKPANLKVTPDGQVKVLDFGLAKALAPDPAASDVMNSPTLTARATEAGVILGTAAYMAPEQARGKAVDKRADIWAFGAVLFEMLTGTRAFEGETVSDTLAAVLRSDPDWSRLPAGVPDGVTYLVKRCLTRNPIERLRDIGEARIALASDVRHVEGPASATSSGETTRDMEQTPAWSRALPWALAALFLATSGAFWWTSRVTPEATGFELAVPSPDSGEFRIGANSGDIAVSVDGTRVAFVASASGAAAAPAIWVRSLASDDARRLPGTEDASYPFWSPDGRTLAFFADSKLKTIDIAGGLPEVMADAPNGRGGSWCDDGQVLFTPAGGGRVVRLGARGARPVPISTLDAARGENAHYWPVCLPGSEKFIYFVRSLQPDRSGIYLSRVDGQGNPVRLVSSLSSGIYAPPLGGADGYLLWARDTDLFAQPLDVGANVLTGTARRIASGVRVEESQRGLFAAVSEDGVLVWATARAALDLFAWYDRHGLRLGPLPIEAAAKFYQPTVSPDGSSFLFTRAENGTADIWRHDFASGTTRRVTTSPRYDEDPSWSPDEQSMAYFGESGAVVVVKLDGSVTPTVLARGQGSMGPWTPDGRGVLVTVQHESTGKDVILARLDHPGDPIPLAEDAANETAGAVSPDGRWLTLDSDRAGQTEVYLTRLFIEGDRASLGSQRLQVLTDGGSTIGWRRDGREILFVSLDHQVMSAPVEPAADTVKIGRPVKLFSLPAGAGDVAMTPDASRFIVVESPFAAGQTLRVLTNLRERLAGSADDGRK